MNNPLLGQAVGNKIKAIREDIVTADVCDSRQAATIPVSAVAYLERVACDSDCKVDALLASGFRFTVGASARIDDTTHIQVSRRCVLNKSIEIVCVQTKVSGATKANGNIVLIAPLVAFDSHVVLT